VGSGSELDYARLVARQLATRHTELLVSADDLMQHLPKLIEHGDAPVAEASNIPIYLLSRKAAKSVKMVLTGEGSDERLGGYPKHSAERFTALYHDGIDRPVRSAGAAAALGAMSLAERNRLLGARVVQRGPDPRRFLQSPQRSTLQRMLYFDETSWLPDNPSGARRPHHHGGLHSLPRSENSRHRLLPVLATAGPGLRRRPTGPATAMPLHRGPHEGQQVRPWQTSFRLPQSESYLLLESRIPLVSLTH
jgi:hypothetical protein